VVSPSATYLRLLSKKLYDEVSIKDYAPAGNEAATDWVSSFTDALAAARVVKVPAGQTYNVTDTITLTTAGHSIRGFGMGAATINATSNAKTVIKANNSLDRLVISGLNLTRSATPLTTAFGLDMGQVTGKSLIENVYCGGHWRGFNLGATDTSLLFRCIAEGNSDTGFYLSNPIGGPTQWALIKCLSQVNSGHGFAITGVNTGISTSTWVECESWANSGYAFCLLGSAANPIHSFRLNGFFVGQEGAGEFLLDTYGAGHQIANGYAELCGTAATGRRSPPPRRMTDRALS
jgi:hypothetical protein